MKTIKINLLDEKTQYGFMPTMTAYILDGNPDEKELRPSVLVIPGGGYAHVSYREGERVALAYNAAGFHTFVLDYCVAPHRHPLPILNAAKAISLIREKAEEWNVDKNKIAVCGFSAGGHLAASISTLWNDSDIFGNSVEENKKHKPDASILCYPVISSGVNAHQGSIINLCGNEPENEHLREKYSLENQVNSETPPAFLWHTFSDSVVPMENSMLYASSLRKHSIPFEMHIYPHGPHGMSVVSDETYWMLPKFTREYPWIKQSIEWLYLLFNINTIEKE